MNLTRREFLAAGGGMLLSLALRGTAAARKGTVPVLRYYGLSHDAAQPDALSPRVFAEQMEYLYGSGYRAVSCTDLPQLDADNAKRTVVISFDGGLASVMQFAFPLFRDYGFSATINVTLGSVGGFIRGRGPCLSWDECRFLALSGMAEIGCCPSGLPGPQGTTFHQQLERELAAFQTIHTKEMGKPAATLAGTFAPDRRIVRIAQEAGFQRILGSQAAYAEVGGDPFNVPRLSVAGKTDLRLFREMIER